MSPGMHGRSRRTSPATRRWWRTTTGGPWIQGREIRGVPTALVLLASSVVSKMVYVGNAGADASESRGWLLGYFKPAGDARHSAEVEVKCAIHPKDDQRSQWVAG